MCEHYKHKALPIENIYKLDDENVEYNEECDEFYFEAYDMNDTLMSSVRSMNE